LIMLFRLVLIDEGHALVLGASGTGKTTLIKQELRGLGELRGLDRVLVVDYLGNYRGFTDYYGPLPLNPLDFIRPKDFIDVISQAVLSTYSNIQSPWSPAQEKVVEDCLRGEAPGNREPATSIPELIQCIRASRYGERDDELARKAVERRIDLLNNLMWARKTHGLLKAWLSGELRGSLGIDLSRLALPEVITYVYALLAILARSRGRGVKGPMIVVVDEAQYYAKATLLGGLSLLEEALRTARNFGIYFIAITQTPGGLRGLLDVFKIYVIFNITNRRDIGDELGFQVPDVTFRSAFNAYVKVLMSSEEAYSEFGGRQLGESGFFSTNLGINPRLLKPLPNAKIIDCPGLDPSLPVVDGRQVRDYITRNIKCLIEAEAGLEAL